MSDAGTPLVFVPIETETTYRICIYADAGEGKTLASATAPGPLLVLNADRPTGWAVARRRHPDKDIRETRYTDHTSLDGLFHYAEANIDELRGGTVIVDPFSNVYDELVVAAPKKRDEKSGEMKPDYELVNSKLRQFVMRMRALDVNLVLIAHEKENEGKKGDGKTYPRLGGMTLIRKLIAEMDIVAHIERTQPKDGEGAVWYGQVQPTDVYVGKDGTDSLGERRVADLSRWVELARAAGTAPSGPVDSDLPWGGDGAVAEASASSAATEDDDPLVEEFVQGLKAELGADDGDA